MKHNHKSLKYKMTKNPNRVYKDLKQKQKVKISNWLYIETYWFYQKHDRMPDESERKMILDTVYTKIRGAAIWIPYEKITIHNLREIAKDTKKQIKAYTKYHLTK